MDADVQQLKANTSFMPVTGNEPSRVLPLDDENNENGINNGNENAIIPTPHSNNIQFETPNVQVPVSSSDN